MFIEASLPGAVRRVLVLAVCSLAACGGGGGGGDPGLTPPAGFRVGGTVSGLTATGLVLQINGGGDIMIESAGDFAFPATLPSGASYAVTIKAQPTSGPAQQCAVSSGSGTVGSAPVTSVRVTCAHLVAKFLYVANAGSDDVSAFSIDAATGTLSAMAGSPYAAGTTPHSATADREGRTLYVTGEGSTSEAPTISVYAIDATGALMEAPDSPFDLPVPGRTPLGTPITHPSGALVYVGTVGAGLLHGATVDAASRNPSPISGLPMTVGAGLGSGVIDAAGKVLYLPHDSHAGGVAGAVSAFFVDASGTLTDIGSFPTGGRVPAVATLNATGKLLFAPNAASGTLSVWSVDLTSGTLSPVAGSPFDAGHDTVPTSVAIHPRGEFVYTTNSFVYGTPDQSSLSAFRLHPATGVLTPIAGSPFSTLGTSATAARIEPRGKFLYVSNHISHNIQAYAIDPATGALASVPGAPFATGLSPTTVKIDPSGLYLYVASSGSHAVSAYAIDATTGALKLINTVPAGTNPSSIELVGLQ